jgi:uroporphyrinogen-III decarboxylase
MEPARWLLRGTPDEVYARLAEHHAVCGARFVVGAGCEVPPDTPLANFRALVRYAREHTNQEHAAAAG